MLEEQDESGNTAYLLACENGRHEIVQNLLDEGKANVLATTNNNLTGLILACRMGHLSVIELLLQLPEDSQFEIDGNGNGQWTAGFMAACQEGHLEVVSRLLDLPDKVIDVNAVDEGGFSGFMLACKYGHLKIINCLLEQPGESLEINQKSEFEGYSGFMVACIKGHLHVVNRLLELHEEKIDVDAKSNGNNTAFILACEKGHHDIVERLLQVQEGRIDFNAQERTLVPPENWSKVDPFKFEERVGNTGLMAACKNGHLEVVKRLLDQPSINKDTVDHKGCTGLDLATKEGHSDVVVAFQKHKQRQNRHGISSLDSIISNVKFS